MNDEQVEALLLELAATRKSFDDSREVFETAIKTIRWNRINTGIQYVLLIAMFIMGGFLTNFYYSEKADGCERDNELLLALDEHAESIGVALTIVSGATPEKFEQYLDAYSQQDRPQGLTFRSC